MVPKSHLWIIEDKLIWTREDKCKISSREVWRTMPAKMILAIINMTHMIISHNWEIVRTIINIYNEENHQFTRIGTCKIQKIWIYTIRLVWTICLSRCCQQLDPQVSSVIRSVWPTNKGNTKFHPSQEVAQIKWHTSIFLARVPNLWVQLVSKGRRKSSSWDDTNTPTIRMTI